MAKIITSDLFNKSIKLLRKVIPIEVFIFVSSFSKTKTEYLAKLTHLMELAKESLEIKRKALDDFMEKGL